MMNLQHNAIEKHITILNLLKKFFNHIKHSNSNNLYTSFNVDKFLEISYNLKNYTSNTYKNLIENYPDEKSTYQLYSLFMKDVMKYTLNEGDSFIELMKISNVKSSASSNGGGSSFGDAESKKKKLNVIFGFIHISNFESAINDIQILGDMDYHLKDTILNIRFYSFAIASKDLEFITLQRDNLKNKLDYMIEYYYPILKPYSNSEKSTTPVIMYTNEINNGIFKDTSYEYFNAFELMNSMNIWIKDIITITPEEWIKKVDAGINVLFDFRFR
ncbi:hypothetical protein BCR36DRAFT_373794 [Piromyces finnis]|uniref:Uncharacterized protein n=1 Tax=Piromyces finnis TaxID=1754191 RepID=A0A1Y1UYP8_9FUNG|nr:hypothetical protein BCR36DRAFT_373794 [Piromyces finnis]|eukprot:ORX43645.1 hypothetical protein BCR36DRAFT_373794 [Piromyces finnis]